MPRGIGYVVARRDHEDPEARHDWALAIEALLSSFVAGFAGHARQRLPRPPAAAMAASGERSRPGLGRGEPGIAGLVLQPRQCGRSADEPGHAFLPERCRRNRLVE